MDKEELKNIVKKLALKNAIDYGKADYKAVLNKTISKDPESKKDMKGLEGIVIEVVNSVNSMEAGQIEKEFSEYKDEFEIEEQKKAEKSSKPRFELPGAKVGEFATGTQRLYAYRPCESCVFGAGIHKDIQRKVLPLL